MRARQYIEGHLQAPLLATLKWLKLWRPIEIKSFVAHVMANPGERTGPLCTPESAHDPQLAASLCKPLHPVTA